MSIERKEVLNEDQSIGYIESVFNSDNVLKTTYFPQSQRLYIAFSRGHTYANVSPEMYQEFENADSQGKFFYKKINNNNAYPYRKEFTLYPNEVKELKTIVEARKDEWLDNAIENQIDGELEDE
jgi:hypothetical protein